MTRIEEARETVLTYKNGASPSRFAVMAVLQSETEVRFLVEMHRARSLGDHNTRAS